MILLPLGIALLALSQMRWGIGLLAFVAPIPFLRWLRVTSGWRPRLWLAGALFAGWTLAVLKIITAPLNPVFAFLYSIPFTLLFGAALLATDVLRRRAPAWVGVLAFPAAMVLAEYAQHRFTPFGTWGAAAYTQVDNLPLLQLASLCGMAGVSFVVYLVAGALEAWIAEPKSGRAPLLGAAAVLIAATAWGSLRLGARTGETALAAAVGTDGTASGWPLPSDEELARVDENLLAHTAQAARAGAKLVAWNEAATVVLPAREPAWLERLRQAAKEHRIELVASYVVPLEETRRYQNKYVWVRPDGAIDHVYHKHHPVPGEPALAGSEPLVAVDTALGRAAGAICYDYDFPSLARAQARLGIDLAVLPSSDWRGIDPIHTQMASLRAIEGGFSLLRSTRFGLTAGYDRYGRVRAWASSFDSDEKVLLVLLPRRGSRTLYAVVGDWLIFTCAAFLAWAALRAWRGR